MSQFIEVIESLDASPDTIVSRHPAEGSGEIKMGAQLVVRESQAAVFFRDGRALDTFGPGRHTLSTLNVPLITKLLSLPTGFTSPFRAEVMFVNAKTFPAQKWGTSEPILFRDSELSMVRLRSFGTYSFRVARPNLFVNTLVGTIPEYTTAAVAEFFRGFIVTHVADFLGEHLDTVLDLPQYYNEISAGIEAHLIADFEKYGVVLSDFRLHSITPPDSVQEMIDKRSSMSAVGPMDPFLRYQAAVSLEKASEGGGSGGDSAAGAGVGIGAGIGMGAGLAGVVSQALSGGALPAREAGPGADGALLTCPACSSTIPAGGRFCPECGQAARPALPCGACNAVVPTGANFCPSCGARQGALICANCQTTSPLGARFCGSCGTALGA